MARARGCAGRTPDGVQRTHNVMKRGEPYAERFGWFWKFPWAWLAMFGFVIYVVIERLTHELGAADSIKAITGIAGLAIGHGVHEHVHYLRLRATTGQDQGGSLPPPPPGDAPPQR